MIVVASGAYLQRSASMWSHNADYTLLLVFKVRTAFTAAIGLTAGNARFDSDNLQFDGSGNTFQPYVRVAGSVVASQNGTFTFSTGGGGPYFGALRRSGNNLEWYVGSTPRSVTLDATASASIAGRGTADRVTFNGEVIGDNLNALQELGRVRVYTAALSLAEIQRELAAVNASRTANLWADWTTDDAADLTDKSGNARPLSSSGTITDGVKLGPMASRAIAGLLAPVL